MGGRHYNVASLLKPNVCAAVCCGGLPKSGKWHTSERRTLPRPKLFARWCGCAGARARPFLRVMRGCFCVSASEVRLGRGRAVCICICVPAWWGSHSFPLALFPRSAPNCECACVCTRCVAFVAVCVPVPPRTFVGVSWLSLFAWFGACRCVMSIAVAVFV